jgi:hypothetical protein
VLAGEADDFLREAVTLVARELMEAEIIFGLRAPARGVRKSVCHAARAYS